MRERRGAQVLESREVPERRWQSPAEAGGAEVAAVETERGVFDTVVGPAMSQHAALG